MLRSLFILQRKDSLIILTTIKQDDSSILTDSFKTTVDRFIVSELFAVLVCLYLITLSSTVLDICDGEPTSALRSNR